jgi:hypothetical protein
MRPTENICSSQKGRVIVDAADCLQYPAHLAFWMSSCRLNSQQMLATG